MTAESCPHYFTLTEDACRGYNTLARCNPPLRTPADRDAVIEGVRDGTLDLIVSDHAPHHADDKDIEFALAKNGMTGMEKNFALYYSEQVQKHNVPLKRVVQALTQAPADLLRLNRGVIRVGAPADLSIFNLTETYTVDRFHQVSKAINTPFHGRTVSGRTRYTIVGGKIAFEAKE